MIFYGINYTTNLIAGQDVEENSVFSILLKIILVVFAILFLKHILNVMKNLHLSEQVVRRENREEQEEI